MLGRLLVKQCGEVFGYKGASIWTQEHLYVICLGCDCHRDPDSCIPSNDKATYFQTSRLPPHKDRAFKSDLLEVAVWTQYTLHLPRGKVLVGFGTTKNRNCLSMQHSKNRLVWHFPIILCFPWTISDLLTQSSMKKGLWGAWDPRKRSSGMQSLIRQIKLTSQEK